MREAVIVSSVRTPVGKAYKGTLRATRPAPGTTGPLIPGDPERAAEAVRRREGIPLLPSVVSDLRQVSVLTGVAFDLT